MQDTVPFVEVTRLPPSASFYSAVCQPLGVRFVSASPSNIVFGGASSGETVFEVRAAGTSNAAGGGTSGDEPRLSRIVLSAPTRSAVADFYAAALRASPDLRKRTGIDCFLRRRRDAAAADDNESGAGATDDEDYESARICDPDGNIMEVVYVNPPGYPSGYGGSTVRRTQSTNREASRILDWNFDVAASGPRARAPSINGGAGGAAYSTAAPYYPRRATAPPPPQQELMSMTLEDDDHPRVLRRSVTTSTIEKTTATAQPAMQQQQQQQQGGGMSTGAVVGTVLGAVSVGAAIGGALTYTLMRKERAPAPHYGEDEWQQHQGAPGQRYVEVERTIKEKVRYPEDYQQQQYQQQRARQAYAASPPDDDRASRAGSQYTMGGQPRRARGRSEAAGTRRPLMLDEHEYRSAAGSAAGGPMLLMDHEYRSNAGSRFSATMGSAPRAPEPVPIPVAAPSVQGGGGSVADYRSRAPSRTRAPSTYSRAPSRSRHGETAAPPPPPPPPPPPAPFQQLASPSEVSGAPRRARASSIVSKPPDSYTYVSGATGRSRRNSYQSTGSTVRPGGGASPGYVPRAVAVEPPPSIVAAQNNRGGIPVRRPSSRSSRAPSQLTVRDRDRDDASTVSRRSRAFWDDDSASLAPDDSISNVGGRR